MEKNYESESEYENDSDYGSFNDIFNIPLVSPFSDVEENMNMGGDGGGEEEEDEYDDTPQDFPAQPPAGDIPVNEVYNNIPPPCRLIRALSGHSWVAAERMILGNNGEQFAGMCGNWNYIVRKIDGKIIRYTYYDDILVLTSRVGPECFLS